MDKKETRTHFIVNDFNELGRLSKILYEMGISFWIGVPKVRTAIIPLSGLRVFTYEDISENDKNRIKESMRKKV